MSSSALDPKEIFNNSAAVRKRANGVYDIGDDEILKELEKKLNVHSAEVTGHFQNQFPLKFYFTDHYAINAFAFHESEFNFIGINIGVPLLLIYFFQKIMSSNNLFSEIGISDKEVQQERWPSVPNDILEAMRWEKEPNSPKCTIRARCGFVLTSLALDFMFFHELGHHVNGHIKFLDHSKGVSFVEEKSGPLSDPLDSHTLEFDADAYAVCQQLRCIDYYVDIFGHKDSILKLILFAQFVPYLLFSADRKNWILFDPKKISSSHPPAPVRHRMQTDTVATYLSDRKKYSEEQLKPIWQAMEECLNMLPVLFDDFSDEFGGKTYESYWETFIYKTDEYKDLMTDNWKKRMRPSLVNFAFEEIPE